MSVLLALSQRLVIVYGWSLIDNLLEVLTGHIGHWALEGIDIIRLNGLLC